MTAIDAMDNHPHKPQMERDELRDVIALSLWAGQLLLQYGADTARVEETVHHIGTGLGCDWMDILVLSDGLIATTLNNQEFRTKVRHVPRLGVNMHIIAEVTDLRYQVDRGELDRFELRKELMRIDSMKPNYNRWITVITVGLACGAFSKLFGGNDIVLVITTIASSVAMFVRQELHHRHFNPLLITAVTAFVAGLIASRAYLFTDSATASIALAACVLLLVPGVPLINSAEDLIHSSINTGLARGMFGILISLAIALGLSLAIWLTGVPGV